jgi:4a-hydroxytetrahydrobiopterin dehydratase
MKKTLNEAEINEVLHTHPHWSLREGRLVREWTFKDFAAAMEFVNQIAAIAEEADHHPDIDVRYNRVLLGLESHDAGGITSRDVSMVKKIDGLPSAH